jgi:microcompartment protein CcmL/EutN
MIIEKNTDVLAALEFYSIAKGFHALDEMVKTAPVKIIDARTISRGKYLIIFSGDVASVEYSFNRAVEIAEAQIVDTMLLRNVHPEVINAIGKIIEPSGWDTVGIVETYTIISSIHAADIAAKESPVKIVEIRISDGYGGKSYVKITGKIEDVQASMDAAVSYTKEKNLLCAEIIIPQPHIESKEFFIK